MTIEEFSNSFDTLLNSYNVQAGFGEGANKQGSITLDEYEKSVLLTQAQDIIVKSYFDRTLNNQGQGFDDTARRQVDFSSLIKVKHYRKDADATHILVHDEDKCYDDSGLLVTLDSNVLFVLNERLETGSGKDEKTYTVVPLNYREYDREKSKAYGQPLKKQAWRLFSNNATGYDIQSEIIPIYKSTELTDSTLRYAVAKEGVWVLQDKEPAAGTSSGAVTLTSLPAASSLADGSYYTVTTQEKSLTYVIRYVERPTPIVLRVLPNNLTIDGYNGSETTDAGGEALDSNIFTGAGINCALNPILHMDILNKAFELAVTTRGGGTVQRQQERSNNQ